MCPVTRNVNLSPCDERYSGKFCPVRNFGRSGNDNQSWHRREQAHWGRWDQCKILELFVSAPFFWYNNCYKLVTLIRDGGEGEPIREGDKYMWTNWHRGHWSFLNHHQLLFFQTSDWIKSFYHFGKFVKTKGWDPREPSGEGGSKGEIVYTTVHTVLYSLYTIQYNMHIAQDYTTYRDRSCWAISQSQRRQEYVQYWLLVTLRWTHCVQKSGDAHLWGFFPGCSVVDCTLDDLGATQRPEVHTEHTQYISHHHRDPAQDTQCLLFYLSKIFVLLDTW